MAGELRREDITPALVAGLVADQFPAWAALPVVPVEQPGWDTITLRLGDRLLVRLPSDDGHVPQVAKEQRWHAGPAAMVEAILAWP